MKKTAYLLVYKDPLEKMCHFRLQRNSWQSRHVFHSQLQNTPQKEEGISKLKNETLLAKLFLLLVRIRYRKAVWFFFVCLFFLKYISPIYMLINRWLLTFVVNVS